MKFRVGKSRRPRECKVVKENFWTVWVQLTDGNVIKRHRVKDAYRPGLKDLRQDKAAWEKHRWGIMSEVV